MAFIIFSDEHEICLSVFSYQWPGQPEVILGVHNISSNRDQVVYELCGLTTSWKRSGKPELKHEHKTSEYISHTGTTSGTDKVK